MAELDNPIARRGLLTVFVGAGMLVPFGMRAQAQGTGILGGVLGRASDQALDKLAQPGAFYSDSAVRINLPGLGSTGSGGILGGIGGMLGGVTGLDGITRKLNDAGGHAAQAAKPVFRAAIAHLSFADVPGLVEHDDGGTRYLRQSAGGELHAAVRPLVDKALVAVGANHEVDQLSAQGGLLAQLGLTRDSLGNSVTGQALNGIFKYMGVEESRLRANPIGAIGGITF